MALSAPRVLWALLLLAPFLGSQQAAWDDPSCTEVVSVPRGQPALMTCNISNPFKQINISAPGKDKQRIFTVHTPGEFSSAGWRLLVRGGEAQLVIQDAQPAQAGEYTWNLEGEELRTKKTRLDVSEAPDELPAVPTPGDELPTGPTPGDELPTVPPSGSEPPQAQKHPMVVGGLLLAVLLCFAAVGLYAWRRSRGPSNLEKLVQMWMFAARREDKEEREQDPLASGILPEEPRPQRPCPHQSHRPPHPGTSTGVLQPSGTPAWLTLGTGVGQTSPSPSTAPTPCTPGGQPILHKNK